MADALRVAGHTLQAEGAAYEQRASSAQWWRVTWLGGTGGVGRGLCSCGDVSEVLDSGAARRAWHRTHKETKAHGLTI